MSNKIKELIDRLRCPKIQSCPVDTNRLSCSQCRKSLHNDAAEALENLDAQLDACVAEDINKTRENEILLSALTKWGAGPGARVNCSGRLNCAVSLVTSAGT